MTLHHVSFGVRDIDRAAAAVAELTGGRVVDAPSPPFPSGSRFVVFGDPSGTLIELTPWGKVHTPSGKGLGTDPEMRPYSASHVLVSSPKPSDEIVADARRLDLPAAKIDAGLFTFVKVWIENSFLLELLPPEARSAYTGTFADDSKVIDERLRQLECRLRSIPFEPSERPLSTQT